MSANYFDHLEAELRAAVPRATAGRAGLRFGRRRWRARLGGMAIAIGVAVTVAVVLASVALLGHRHTPAGTPALHHPAPAGGIRAPDADCVQHLKLTHPYTVQELQNALNNMPAYEAEYSPCPTVIANALRADLGKLDNVGSLTLRRDGIGTMRFGLSKVKAEAELRALFGAPTAQGVNTGCGPGFTEVEWHDLAAEFHLNRLSGYRYIRGGLRLTAHSKALKTVAPKLATATGITLGSTLGQLHSAYKALQNVAPDRWQARNGLMFVDNATRLPAPLSSRIIEIKIGTCGNY
jgi:hypothetical protein